MRQSALSIRMLLALMLALVLGACSPALSEEEQVRAVVDESFSSLAQLSQEGSGEASQAAAQLESFGIDPAEFFSRVLGNLSYELGEVRVSEEKAEVEASVSNARIGRAMIRATSRFTEWAETAEASQLYASEGEQGLYRMLFKFFYEQLEKSPGARKVQLTLKLKRDKSGAWKLDEQSSEQLESAVLGDVDLLTKGE